MNKDVLESLNLNEEEINLIHSNVKWLMESFGFEIQDKGLPSIRINYLQPKDQMYYEPDKHEVIVNPFMVKKSELICGLAHEFTHSLQNLENYDFKIDYCERKDEVEAYAIQALYPLIFGFKSNFPRKLWGKVPKWFKTRYMKDMKTFVKRAMRDVKDPVIEKPFWEMKFLDQ